MPLPPYPPSLVCGGHEAESSDLNGANYPSLATRRLLLRPLELADAPAIEAIFPQWEVVRFLTAQIPWPFPPGESERFLRDVALPAIQAGHEWQWSIRRRAAPGALIGIMHLRDGEEDNRGFWIDPAWQGQGFATEACAAATEYWFGVLGKTVLRAPKAAGNIASRRISEKTGMRLVRVEERDYVCGRLPAEIWEITSEQWRRRAGR